MNEASLLTINMDEPTRSKLDVICASLRIQPRHVPKAVLTLPLGALLKSPVDAAPTESAAAGFEEPMLVMCGFEEAQFNAFLQALRYSGLPRIDLKAVLTPTNIGWTPVRLRDELLREHAEMQRLRGKK